jgi:hypothetical protein
MRKRAKKSAGAAHSGHTSSLLPPFTLAKRDESRQWRRLLVLIAAIYCLTFNSISVGDTDDQLMITSAFTFTEMGKFLAPSRFATKEFHGFLFGMGTASGEVYSKYPFGYSLVLVLFLPLADLAGRLFGSAGADVVLCLPSVIALLGTAALIWRSSLRLGFSAATAHRLALAFTLGSFAWGYTGTNYNEPYQALCAVAAFYCLLAAQQEPRHWRIYTLLGGCALGYGILLRPYFGILAPVLVLGALMAWRQCLSLRAAFLRATLYAAPALMASIYLLATNLVLFGDSTNFGYGREHFDTPFSTGFFGLLLGPRKGLLWFFPLAAMVPWSAWRLWQSGKQWAVSVLATAAAAQILLMSKWWGFESGRAWGDRLILAILPFVVLLAGSLGQSSWAKRVAGTLLILGIGMNCLGVLINRMASEQIVISSNLPHSRFGPFSGQLPTHFWLLMVEATGPVLGVEDANPLWSKPPWIYRYPQCVPAAYRNARYPVLNPWPLRLFLPAERWTRRENGYMRGLLEIAIMRFEKRETRRAMELIDRGLSLDAKSPEFLAAKGMALMESGPAALALEFFDRSIAADPAYDLGLYGRGLIMEVTGNFAAARDAYTRLLAAPPGTLDHKAVKMRLEKLPQ